MGTMLTIPPVTKPQTSNRAFAGGTFNHALKTQQPRCLPVRRLSAVAALLALIFYALMQTGVSPAILAGSVPRQSGERRTVFTLPALCATSDIQGPDGLHALQCALPASR